MITQSMLFPWVGLLEQVRLSDVVVHYDDVQFSKGSRVNRVQLKTPEGSKWMTVPLVNRTLAQTINDVEIDFSRPWQAEHFSLLQRSLTGAPHIDDAKHLVQQVYSLSHKHISGLARASFMSALRYFELDVGRKFVSSSDIVPDGSSSERVLKIVKSLGGTEYVTGHGAKNYLDHEAFEAQGIQVSYMDYALAEYPQQYGAFLPYVSCLDLIANCGRSGRAFMQSGVVGWRDFVDQHV